MKSRAVKHRMIEIWLIAGALGLCLGMFIGWLIMSTHHNVDSRNFEYGKKMGALQSYKDCNDWAMMTAFVQGFDAAVYLSERDREKIRMMAVAGRIKSEKEAQEWFDSVSEKIAKREGRYFEKHKGNE